MKNYTFIFLITLILFGCDFSDTKLKVVNNSGQNVVLNVYSKWNESNSDCVDCRIIEAGDTLKLPARNTTWEHQINNHLNSLLTLHVYQEDTFRTTEWAILKNNRKLLFSEINLTVNELDSLNWIIDIPKK